MINTYDIDGVINMGPKYSGLVPRSGDIIITGRSFQEKDYTETWLYNKGIYNCVYFNPLPFEDKTRQSSGKHKANIINQFLNKGIEIGLHFEDDPIQADIIEQMTPVKVVRIVHELVEKENVWHGETNDPTVSGTVR